MGKICDGCKKEFDEEEFFQNGKCIDCFAKKWAKIVESPGGTIVSPEILEYIHDKEKRNEMK